MARQGSGDRSGTRYSGRDVEAPPARRVFYIILGALLLVGIAVLGYAWRRSQEESAPREIERVASVPATLGYVRGSPDARVEIVEFADFECPGCGEFATRIEPEVRVRLIETGIARFRLLDFQVNPSHANSPAASIAAACANDQGKFWEMHDRIFAGQKDWNSLVTDTPKPVFQRYAQQIGVDAKTWEECYDARRHSEKGAAHLEQARRVGLQYTPSFVIGSQMLSGGQSYDAIKAAVDEALASGTATPQRPD